MSRKRLRHSQPQPDPVTIIEGLIPPPPPAVQRQLEEHQARNLRWCEEWGRSMPPVDGVPICLSLSYDLIQILNRAMVANGG